MLYPYDNALVVTMDIASRKMARVIVNAESLVDIIFTNEHIYIKSVKMCPQGTPLVKFTGEMVIPEGIVSLLVIVINSYYYVLHLVDFFLLFTRRVPTTESSITHTSLYPSAPSSCNL